MASDILLPFFLHWWYDFMLKMMMRIVWSFSREFDCSFGSCCQRSLLSVWITVYLQFYSTDYCMVILLEWQEWDSGCFENKTCTKESVQGLVFSHSVMNEQPFLMTLEHVSVCERLLKKRKKKRKKKDSHKVHTTGI